MRKQDLTVPALLLEAVVIILTVGYIVLQIIYGIIYARNPLTILMNAVVIILIYLFFTFLSIYPERVNRLPAELCVGDVRKYTLRMLRLEKLVLTIGFLIPSIFDVIERTLPALCSALIMICIILIAIYYEARIIQTLRKRD